MANLILVDNDVILKLLAYHEAHFIVKEIEGAPAAMLSIARFVIRKRICNYVNDTNDPGLLETLEPLLSALVQIEPAPEEIDLAAQLEETALKNGLDLDVGEAQLLAVMATREADLLLTGDKRAVVAINRCLPAPVKHRIVCFEQIIATILQTTDYNELRGRVCAKPNVDRALTACFSCFSSDVQSEDILQGLSSYCSDLRRKSGNCLIAADSMKSRTC